MEVTMNPKSMGSTTGSVEAEGVRLDPQERDPLGGRDLVARDIPAQSHSHRVTQGVSHKSQGVHLDPQEHDPLGGRDLSPVTYLRGHRGPGLSHKSQVAWSSQGEAGSAPRATSEA